MLIAVHLGFDPSLSSHWTVDQWLRMSTQARSMQNDVRSDDG